MTTGCTPSAQGGEGGQIARSRQTTRKKLQMLVAYVRETSCAFQGMIVGVHLYTRFEIGLAKSWQYGEILILTTYTSPNNGGYLVGQAREAGVAKAPYVFYVFQSPFRYDSSGKCHLVSCPRHRLCFRLVTRATANVCEANSFTA